MISPCQSFVARCKYWYLIFPHHCNLRWAFISISPVWLVFFRLFFIIRSISSRIIIDQLVELFRLQDSRIKHYCREQLSYRRSLKVAQRSVVQRISEEGNIRCNFSSGKGGQYNRIGHHVEYLEGYFRCRIRGALDFRFRYCLCKRVLLSFRDERDGTAITKTGMINYLQLLKQSSRHRNTVPLRRLTGERLNVILEGTSRLSERKRR